MTNKAQREQWADKFYEYENQKKGCECSTECLLKSWLAACEYQQKKIDELENSYQFLMHAKKLIYERSVEYEIEAVLNRKKIDALANTLEFISGFDSNCEAHSLISSFKKEARQALQKIKELDEREGK